MVDPSLDFTNPSQFGTIEGVFVNTGDKETPKEHQSLDVIYSNGLRVLYHPTVNSTNGNKVELRISSIEFFDASLIERIFKMEPSFNGFKYYENGNIDTKFVESGSFNEYSPSADLKARAIAIAESGLYHGTNTKKTEWYKANCQTAVDTFWEIYNECKGLSDKELDARIKEASKPIVKWKIEEAKKRKQLEQQQQQQQQQQ